MSEGCSHNCSSCNKSCGEKKGKESLLAAANPGSNVKKVIAVISGKGGVGKSFITSMLSVIAKKRGIKSAVLDADVTGPSIPKSFGIKENAKATELGLEPVLSKKLGIPMMSLNLLLENVTDPVIWRGPVIAGAVKQFWTDVVWGNVDCMFIDMPPGTGDVPLTVFQSLPVDGVIVVASPQELVGMIVEKALNMTKMMNIPVLALVENMSFFECSKCGEKHYIFGESHIEAIAEKYGIKTVARIPINPEAAKSADLGLIEDLEIEPLNAVVDLI